MMIERKLDSYDIRDYSRRLKRLSKHVWRHFSEDRCLEEAASLSYTSLLATVPLLAVVFGVVAAFPVFGEWSDRLKTFMFSNFVPAAGEQIEAYMDTFLDSVSGLTLPGTITLIATALLLMVRIEVALNRIWRVDTSRTITNRVVMYWAVLTLGPVLIGAALALSAQKVLGVLGLEENDTAHLHGLGIFVLTWIMFAMMFTLVPNRRVRIRNALIGAFLTATLFELAKLGFVAYVSNANYKVIYGALATIPIFLFWLYLVWTVVLFGASLAASLTTFTDRQENEDGWPARLEFQLAYRLVGHLWREQISGGKLTGRQLLDREESAGQLQLRNILRRLEDAKIVALDQEEHWMLSRDLEELSLADLYRCGDWYLPLEEQAGLPVEDDWDRSFAAALDQLRRGGRLMREHPLRSMYRQEHHAGAKTDTPPADPNDQVQEIG
jgi:membrane protein